MRLSVAGVVAMLILLAAPANAKVPAEVEITGPRLETHLKLGDAEAFEYANLAGIAGFREGVRAPHGTPPTGDLGPRYLVRFTLHTPTPREAVQYLYPFAEGGPVVYTPAGQRLFDAPRPLDAGWAHPDVALLDLLRSTGLPTWRSGQPADASVGGPPEGAPVFMPLAVLGMLLLGAATIERRRAAATA